MAARHLDGLSCGDASLVAQTQEETTNKTNNSVNMGDGADQHKNNALLRGDWGLNRHICSWSLFNFRAKIVVSLACRSPNKHNNQTNGEAPIESSCFMTGHRTHEQLAEVCLTERRTVHLCEREQCQLALAVAALETGLVKHPTAS